MLSSKSIDEILVPTSATAAACTCPFCASADIELVQPWSQRVDVQPLSRRSDAAKLLAPDHRRARHDFLEPMSPTGCANTAR
jgi:hypothetical protein